MALYSQSVKNLVAGVSQQPPILRLAEQLGEQINGFSTEVEGLQKRPPTLHIKSISEPNDNLANPLVHFINRDASERYLLYFWNGSLAIMDLEGNFKNLTFESNSAAYINTDNPRKDLRVVTVADYSFIVNRNVSVRMSTTLSPNAFKTQGALVHVKTGQYGRTYKIFVDDTCIASHTTPNGNESKHVLEIDTSYIVNALVEKCKASGWLADAGESWLRIEGEMTSIKTQDGFNNQSMIAIKNTVQKFSLLPATAPANYCVKVKGDPNGQDAGSYYVKYNAIDKVWEECCAPNLATTIDPQTMPHALIRNADGSFTLKTLSWDERKVGDEDSNPLPSFIDKTLNDVFFFRNRLGFLSSENVILSESGEYFNFWMKTATDLLDTDCIDIPVSSARVNILNHAIAFNEDLYVFSNDAQFVLRVDSVLSPKNVALPEITSFANSPMCRPIVAGKNMYFPAERASFTTIEEYYTVQNISDIKNAQDITAHVPSYIPNGVYSILGATEENIMCFLTTGERDAIYVYKYRFENEQRIQASWSKWKFEGAIFGGCFVNSKLYLLLNRGSTLTLECINFTFNTMDFPQEKYRVYLDRKKVATSMLYDAIHECTQFNILSEYALSNLQGIEKIGLVLSDGKYKEITKSEIDANGTFWVTGNHQNTNVILGIPYNFKAVLSPIYIKKQDQSGGVHSVTTGRLQLRRIHLHHSKTGGFTVTVKMKNGKSFMYRMTSRTLGVASSRLGDIPDDTGSFSFPVQTLNTNCEISIESEMPLPLALVGFLWEGTFIQRTKGG